MKPSLEESLSGKRELTHFRKLMKSRSPLDMAMWIILENLERAIPGRAAGRCHCLGLRDSQGILVDEHRLLLSPPSETNDCKGIFIRHKSIMKRIM